MPHILPDLIGQRFGKLTVLSFSHSGRWGRYWTCLCDCGGQSKVSTNSLRRGNTKSCGCGKVPTKHGTTKRGQKPPLTYRIWMGMRDRCLSPSKAEYARYGGRGVKVCARWNDYSAFLEDMGECPPGMSLDRIDNNGDYSPENCRWADRETQHNNTRRNVFFTHDGVTLTRTQWERRLGLPADAIRMRMRLGWSFEKSILTPYTPRSQKAA